MPAQFKARALEAGPSHDAPTTDEDWQLTTGKVGAFCQDITMCDLLTSPTGSLDLEGYFSSEELSLNVNGRTGDNDEMQRPEPWENIIRRSLMVLANNNWFQSTRGKH